MEETIEKPLTIWSFNHNAEEVVTVYGALRTYLKVLSQQPEEDLEMIVRVARLMTEMKSRAVIASRELAGEKDGAN